MLVYSSLQFTYFLELEVRHSVLIFEHFNNFLYLFRNCSSNHSITDVLHLLAFNIFYWNFSGLFLEGTKCNFFNWKNTIRSLFTGDVFPFRSSNAIVIQLRFIVYRARFVFPEIDLEIQILFYLSIG